MIFLLYVKVLINNAGLTKSSLDFRGEYLSSLQRKSSTAWKATEKKGFIICRANQWTGCYMIGASLMKELIDSPSCVCIL